MRAAACALLLAAALARGEGLTDFQPPPRSSSATGQFVVFAEDTKLRLAVAGFAEEVKETLYGFLGARPDDWEGTIVINFLSGSAVLPGVPPSQVRLLALEQGFKVQVDARLDAEPAVVALERQIARAVLLEFIHRGQGLIRAGEAYREPPAWLIDGVLGQLAIQRRGLDADIFKSLIGAGRLPSISRVLYADPTGYDSTSRALYEAYALSLLQLLADQPLGKKQLAEYVRAVPQTSGDAVADLLAHYPALGGSTDTLEKWWTLSMARLSTSDRYEGLSIEASERELAALLVFKLPGKSEPIAIENYRTLAKTPAGRTVVKTAHDGVVSLAARANPLYRPVLAEYEKILAQLARGKTRGLAERLESALEYRELVTRRMDDIADHMNWFEATQMLTRSHAFDAYLRAARAGGSSPAGLQRGPVAAYLDEVEKQYR